MRRVWFALVLVLLLPAAGLAVMVQTERICQPIAALLEQAENASAEDAARLCTSARESWEQSRKFVASVTDHEPMEEVDAAFRSLEVYLRYSESMHFSQCCAHLASQIRALGESQSVDWWNIF